MTEETAHAGNSDVTSVVASCRVAHERLLRTIVGLNDEMTFRASELPAWTVGHVLAHIARNAESHVRMLEASMRGEEAEQYAGGYDQRAADIDAGADRPAAALVEDVRATSHRLEETWDRMPAEAWNGHGLARGRPWSCSDMPFHRWREVEIHHADLGLGYRYDDWPEEYVRRELPRALATLPTRLGPEDRRQLLAWLLGRAEEPAGLQVEGWDSQRGHYFTTSGSDR